jgi:hypothetical protein
MKAVLCFVPILFGFVILHAQTECAGSFREPVIRNTKAFFVFDRDSLASDSLRFSWDFNGDDVYDSVIFRDSVMFDYVVYDTFTAKVLVEDMLSECSFTDSFAIGLYRNYYELEVLETLWVVTLDSINNLPFSISDNLESVVYEKKDGTRRFVGRTFNVPVKDSIECGYLSHKGDYYVSTYPKAFINYRFHGALYIEDSLNAKDTLDLMGDPAYGIFVSQNDSLILVNSCLNYVDDYWTCFLDNADYTNRTWMFRRDGTLLCHHSFTDDSVKDIRFRYITYHKDLDFYVVISCFEDSLYCFDRSCNLKWSKSNLFGNLE